MSTTYDILLPRRQRVADAAFGDYDFGPFDIEAAQPWVMHHESENFMARRLTIGEATHTQGDETPGFDVSFTVRFRPGTDELESVACISFDKNESIGSFPLDVQGYTNMLFVEWTAHADRLRDQAKDLLELAQSLDGLKPYIATHSHEYGSSSYVLWSQSAPQEASLVDVLEIDYEPEKGEFLTVEDAVKTEELTGSSPVTRLSSSLVE